jgi:hypothetical protein
MHSYVTISTKLGNYVDFKEGGKYYDTVTQQHTNPEEWLDGEHAMSISETRGNISIIENTWGKIAHRLEQDIREFVYRKINVDFGGVIIIPPHDNRIFIELLTILINRSQDDANSDDIAYALAHLDAIAATAADMEEEEGTATAAAADVEEERDEEGDAAATLVDIEEEEAAADMEEVDPFNGSTGGSKKKKNYKRNKRKTIKQRKRRTIKRKKRTNRKFSRRRN